MSAILRGGVISLRPGGRASAGHYVPKASDDIGRSRYSRKNVKLGFSPGNAGKARYVSVFRC
ncbi:hypothetical protein C6T65_04605 [Burkholderia vietnamiensis]|uniref:Uncharacterized protein n=1 Tax=Burkholderia vietnamiensis TaxID=60552 RepID=A0AA44Y3V3_BURVI|nr:hypothetical protein C6T65_04605 [Burkholderia vietnamiensis]